MDFKENYCRIQVVAFKDRAFESLAPECRAVLIRGMLRSFLDRIYWIYRDIANRGFHGLRRCTICKSHPPLEHSDKLNKVPYPSNELPC